MAGLSDLFQPKHFYDFAYPCNAGCFREASPVARGRDQHSPRSVPAGFLPGYLVRARQDFFLQAVQHAFDCGHASVELMDLQERGERERETGKRSREQTSHHCPDSEETVQPQQRKASSRTLPLWAELKDIKK